MKVLVVAHAFPPEGVGGTERYAETVARALRERGHETSVFCGSIEWRPELAVERRVDRDLPVTTVHRSDLYFDHWDKAYNPHVSRCFEEELERVHPDVLHVNHWIRLSSDLVRRAARRGIPSVVHLHDLYTTCPRVFRVREEEKICNETMGVAACLHCVPRWTFQGDAEIAASLEQFALQVGAEVRAAGVLVAPSRSHARFLEEKLGLATGRIEVLPHPVLPGPWQKKGRPAGSPPGRLKLLYFAHLHPVKGAHVLLEALRLLGPGSGVEVDLLGDFVLPDYEERLRALAAGLAVRFHGRYAVGDPAAVAADAVVIPTLARESYSFWLDEALELGLPVLASRLGALEERGAGRVLLVEAGDARAWAHQIAHLRDAPEERARLAARAVPGDSVPLAAHVERLEELLRRARPPAEAPVLPAPEDLTYEWDRRELAFRELLRSEGWEDVIRRQNEQLAELRKSGAARRATEPSPPAEGQ